MGTVHCEEIFDDSIRREPGATMVMKAMSDDIDAMVARKKGVVQVGEG